MKKLALLFAAVFVVAGVAVADEKPAAPAAASQKTVAAAKTHEVEAEIVSVDAAKHTLTLKGDTENKTVPVEGSKAIAALKDVKPGSKVTLVCKDNEKGEHKAVVGIKTAPVAK